MKKTALFIVVAIALQLTAGHAQSNEWYKFEKKEMGFKIEFPGKPKTKIWRVDTAVGFYYESTQFLYRPKEKKDDNIYSVLYVEYPDSLYNSDKMNKETLEDFYRKVINDEMKRIEYCKLLSETIITLKGYSGRDVKISFEDTPRILNLRIFFAKNNLYLIETSVDPKNELTPVTNRFLDSFDLLYL